MDRPKDLDRYRYDALNRIIDVAGIKRFYNQSRLATTIQSADSRSIFQCGDQLLGESHHLTGVNHSNVLAMDQQRSVLHTTRADKKESISYNVYGYPSSGFGLSSSLGFNGELPDPVTGHYLLGNGYRAFNPILMRFNSPDSWSPFGKGGINSYAYCGGDPVNNTDPSGHAAYAFFKGLIKKLSLPKGQAGPIDSLVNDRLINPLGKKVTTFSNIKNIMPDILIGTEHKAGGKLRLNISAHGGYDPIRGGYLINEGKPISPETLYKVIGSEELSRYSSLRVMACFSADGAQNGFSKRLANLTRKPVKGYLSVLAVEYDLVDIYSGVNQLLGRPMKAADRVDIIKESVVLKGARIRETNISNDCSYGPRTFFPD